MVPLYSNLMRLVKAVKKASDEKTFEHSNTENYRLTESKRKQNHIQNIEFHNFSLVYARVLFCIVCVLLIYLLLFSMWCCILCLLERRVVCIRYSFNIDK